MTHPKITGIHHIGLTADDNEAVLSRYKRIFRASIGIEKDPEQSAARKAVLTLGRTHVEISAPPSPQPPGRSGWYSLGLRTESISDDVRALDPRTIRNSPARGEHHVHAESEDLHGLRLEFVAADPAVTATSGARPDSDGPEDLAWGATGGLTVKVASQQPAAAAGRLAEFLGGAPYTHEHPHLNSTGHGLSFGDHNLEFVGSLTDSTEDLVGRFLTSHGESIFCLTITVDSMDRARKDLVHRGVPFSQWGRSSLLLGPEFTRGTLIEITDAG
ncbi:hypothetical protein [Streptomyces sp. NPDC051572]|uniref:VOC family protein n=1 Tax=unclassified Streptomyces TaxID=2593676 RepID=UPI00344EFC4B